MEKAQNVSTIGFVVNPIAGMGGAVGLKGTDGRDTLLEAIRRGAKPVAPGRAESYLSNLKRKRFIRLIVGAGSLGEDEAQTAGLPYVAIGQRKSETEAEDTIQTAKMITEEKADLLVFCGGDGTARDVLDIVDMKVPVLGVPTGVKMHSAVFAITPEAAARVTDRFLRGELPVKEAEVMDVDENAFRHGRLSAELHGYVLTPFEPNLVQANKLASLVTESELRNQAAIAIYIIEKMDPGVIYIIGPGTTTRTIADLLDTKKTLLGVDLFLDKKLVASDVNEQQILEAISGKEAKIIVTPIGGQGFVFGRGNQQLTPRVIGKVGLNNIIVVATESKLRSLKTLRIDTGDIQFDDVLRKRGFIVVTDYRIERRVKAD